ncbi:MAG: hypothetical protein WBC99_07965 [Candidatus Omnitrophota bacterium]
MIAPEDRKKGGLRVKGKIFTATIIAVSLIFIGAHLTSADSMKEIRNKNGDIVEKRYYRDDGSLEQVEKYDDLGHKIGVGYYGSNGKLRESSDGWAAMRWKYKDGKVMGEGYYGADGHLKELKQYNELGDLVAKQYIGSGLPDPSEEYNPIPPLSGETNSYYDRYGRPEGSTSISYDPVWFPELWLLDEEYND